MYTQWFGQGLPSCQLATLKKKGVGGGGLIFVKHIDDWLNCFISQTKKRQETKLICMQAKKKGKIKKKKKVNMSHGLEVAPFKHNLFWDHFCEPVGHWPLLAAADSLPPLVKMWQSGIGKEHCQQLFRCWSWCQQ